MGPANWQFHSLVPGPPEHEKLPTQQLRRHHGENPCQTSFNATSCFSGFKSSTHLTLNLGEHPSQSPVHPGEDVSSREADAMPMLPMDE